MPNLNSTQTMSSSPLRKPLLRHSLHHLAKSIELGQRRIDIWRDAQPFELIVDNRRHKYFVFVEEVRPKRARIDVHDLHVADPARLVLRKGSVEADIRQILELVHPVT